MAQEKLFTAKQAAFAVLEKVGEVLKKAELAKAHTPGQTGHMRGVHWQSTGVGSKPGESAVGMHVRTKSRTPGDLKEEHKSVLGEMKRMPAPNLGKSEQPKGEIHPKEHVEGEPVKPGARIEAQVPPQDNTHEQAEGNNEPAGTTPKDGIEQNEELKGHLKLAKFIGRMEHKRVSKKVQSTAR